MTNNFYIQLLLCFAFTIFGTSCSNNIPEEPKETSEEQEITITCANGIVYVEKDGIVSAEIESVEGTITWDRKSDISGFDGEGYLVWNKEDNFNTPGVGVLTYKLNITTTGTYRFVWRSRITEGTSISEANDSWLRFGDAADFFGEKEGSIVYPKGIGKTPNPEGSSSDGWFKVYMNNVGEWFWRSNTSDNDPHNIFVTFNSAGTYTMEVSGRSRFHALDRFVLFIESKTLEEAQNAARSEIICP